MKRLSEILNYVTNRDVNINMIHFDDATATTLIFLIVNSEEYLIELGETSFKFYSLTVEEFDNYTIEEIIKYLDEHL